MGSVFMKSKAVYEKSYINRIVHRINFSCPEDIIDIFSIRFDKLYIDPILWDTASSKQINNWFYVTETVPIVSKKLWAVFYSVMKVVANIQHSELIWHHVFV